jgi:phosphoribosyl-ATP pyrophosphohydrolase/phosphoribosyl-AMP cyclohydrolase
MIIPSIDLMNGQTVQLIGGEKHALDAGDPRPIATSFARVGEIAVVDLDAALGKGSNAHLIHDLIKIAPCRVGGGIRDTETALAWLHAGATKVVLGTAAKPDILSQLPKERVIAALDAKHGEVVVEGWTRNTGETIFERMHALRGLVGGFLVTFVEREGRLQGLDLNLVKQLKEAAGDVELTVAGGVTTPQDVADIDRIGAYAQVGMALYTGRFDLADALGAMLQSDRPDGLWPTVVTDEQGIALGLCYSSLRSLKEALRLGQGVYESRTRGLWHKGASSGATQELVNVSLDCDRDALKFVVKQHGPGFCHQNTHSCWGNHQGIAALEKTLQKRVQEPQEHSYTQRLLKDAALLQSKITEEALELAQAHHRNDVVHEAADVLYFTMVAMAKYGVSLQDINQELHQRTLHVFKRPGDAKPAKGV